MLQLHLSYQRLILEVLRYHHFSLGNDHDVAFHISCDGLPIDLLFRPYLCYTIWWHMRGYEPSTDPIIRAIKRCKSYGGGNKAPGDFVKRYQSDTKAICVKTSPVNIILYAYIYTETLTPNASIYGMDNWLHLQNNVVYDYCIHALDIFTKPKAVHISKHGVITSAMAKVMFSSLSVSLSVCLLATLRKKRLNGFSWNLKGMWDLIQGAIGDIFRMFHGTPWTQECLFQLFRRYPWLLAVLQNNS